MIRVLKQLDSKVIKYIDEVIVVNNRSTDNTEAVVTKFIQEAKVHAKLLRNDENYGLGGSHKVAFDYAIKNNFDYAIVLHGDDQGDIHDIVSILENKKYRDYDCYLGARFLKGSKLDGYSLFRTFGNIVYNMLFSIVTFKPIYDLGSGLNMYKVNMLNGKFYIKFPDDLTFNYCMILSAQYYNHNIKFFPISWREDDQVSNVKMFSQAIRVLNMLMTYFFKSANFIKSDLRAENKENYTAKVIYENKIPDSVVKEYE